MKFNVFLGCVGFAFSSAVFGAVINSNVGVININQDHGGVFVELIDDSGSNIVVDTDCGNSNLVYFPLDSEVNKSKYSALLTAKVSNLKIRSITRDCHAASNTPILVNVLLGG